MDDRGRPGGGRSPSQDDRPTLIWKDEHFHVQDLDPVDSDLPALRQIELGVDPVGALDFLPLPQRRRRTLMRLFLCSDLGTTCSLEHGSDVMHGFATAWIQRLARLGFMMVESGARQRPKGFPIPQPNPTSFDSTLEGAPLETAAKSEADGGADAEPDDDAG